MLKLIYVDNWPDEKYLIGKMDRKIEEYEHFARENAKDIIALGFDPDRAFIFSDYGFMGSEFYRNITRVAKVRAVRGGMSPEGVVLTGSENQ